VRALYDKCVRARCNAGMANWCIWQTDYGKSIVANRHMVNWHVAKRHHISLDSGCVTKGSSIFRPIPVCPIKLGQGRLGQVRSGQVRSGQVRLD